MKKQIIFYSLILFSALTNAQIYHCGNGSDNHLITDVQGAEAQMQIDNAFARKYTTEFFNASEKGPILSIPIVFHVIHNYGSENIPDSEINDAVETMNARWRKTDPDSVDIVNPYDLIHDDMEVQFVLATKTPNGDCINGITRYVSELTSQGGGNQSGDLIRTLTTWPPSQYLNVFVCSSVGSGVGGYSNYPANAAAGSIDGIMLRSDQLSALSHEAGHYLNLRHLWGNSNDNSLPANCSDDDLVDDTPNCEGSPGGCNTSRVTCLTDPEPFYAIDNTTVLWPSGQIIDNEQNVMDYAFCDETFNTGENFTQGQKARVLAALSSSTASRNNLVTASNLGVTGADGSTCIPVPIPGFDISYEYFCVDYNIQMLNNSHNSDNMTYLWDFDENSTANSNTSKEPSVSWSETGKYDVTLTVENSNNDGGTLTRNGIAKVLNSIPLTPFAETFQAANFPTNDVTDPTKSWFIDGVSNDKSFERTTLASTDGGTSLKLDIKNTTGVHRLISPMIDLTQASCNDLTFDLAYAPRTSSTDETFRVRVSSTCGRTWTNSNILYEVNKQNIAPNSPVLSGDYIPTEADWTTHTVDLSGYTNKDEILFMFEMETTTGNSLYIDNIKFACSDQTLTSVDEKLILKFEVYPNPTNSDAFISLASNMNGANIKIMDVTGKIVGSDKLTIGTRQILVSELVNQTLEKGVYLITVDNGNSVITEKLIIK